MSRNLLHVIQERKLQCQGQDTRDQAQAEGEDDVVDHGGVELLHGSVQQGPGGEPGLDDGDLQEAGHDDVEEWRVVAGEDWELEVVSPEEREAGVISGDNLLGVVTEGERRPHVGGEAPGESLDTESQDQQQGGAGAEEVHEVPPASPDHHVATEVEDREQPREEEVGQRGNGRQESRRHENNEARDDCKSSPESQADNEAENPVAWQQSEDKITASLHSSLSSPVEHPVRQEPHRPPAHRDQRRDQELTQEEVKEECEEEAGTQLQLEEADINTTELSHVKEKLLV